jgi:hypothetical protein
MAELLRHRQTKEAATDMFTLQPPRHIPTLPWPCATFGWRCATVAEIPGSGKSTAIATPATAAAARTTTMIVQGFRTICPDSYGLKTDVIKCAPAALSIQTKSLSIPRIIQ